MFTTIFIAYQSAAWTLFGVLKIYSGLYPNFEIGAMPSGPGQPAIDWI
jgi:hypothetical protein